MQSQISHLPCSYYWVRTRPYKLLLPSLNGQVTLPSLCVHHPDVPDTPNHVQNTGQQVPRKCHIVTGSPSPKPNPTTPARPCPQVGYEQQNGTRHRAAQIRCVIKYSWRVRDPEPHSLLPRSPGNLPPGGQSHLEGWFDTIKSFALWFSNSSFNYLH